MEIRIRLCFFKLHLVDLNRLVERDKRLARVNWASPARNEQPREKMNHALGRWGQQGGRGGEIR